MPRLGSVRGAESCTQLSKKFPPHFRSFRRTFEGEGLNMNEETTPVPNQELRELQSAARSWARLEKAQELGLLKGLSATAIRVYLYYLGAERQHGRSYWRQPLDEARSFHATKLDMADRTVATAEKKLQEAGLIRIKHHSYFGQQKNRSGIRLVSTDELERTNPSRTQT